MLASGTQIGPYRITAPLGSGGMGEVYLAEDPRLSRQVAIKVLSSAFTQDATRVRRFEREARAASSLNHPNIITIHNIGESDVGRFIVMELVEGHTLRNVLAESPPFELVLKVARQVSEALDVAHRAGIVHRDIKPANVMLRHDGYVKVLDFGLVRLVAMTGPLVDETKSMHDFSQTSPPASAVSHAGMIVGTAPYMSPEQANGGLVTSASDMFSFGMLLYELASGSHPFASDSPLAYMHSIVSKSPESLSKRVPDIPAKLESLVTQLLEKDPQLRPSAETARAVLESLAANNSALSFETMRTPERPVVGRDSEYTKLEEGLRQAASGHGSLICVTGEPGIGKTTLIDEFLSSTMRADQSARIARGRCSERLAGSEAYLPFLSLNGPVRPREDGWIQRSSVRWSGCRLRDFPDCGLSNPHRSMVADAVRNSIRPSVTGAVLPSAGREIAELENDAATLRPPSSDDVHRVVAPLCSLRRHQARNEWRLYCSHAPP